MADLMCTSVPAIKIATGLFRIEEGKIAVFQEEENGYYAMMRDAFSSRILYRVAMDTDSLPEVGEMDVFSFMYDDMHFSLLGPLTGVL